MTPRTGNWTVIVPMKALGEAKSRLREVNHLAQGAPDTTELATAFLRDVVQAASRATHVREVLVISPDVTLAAALRGEPSRFLAEVPQAPGEPEAGGINRAITQATQAARTTSPRASVAAITGDLAALTSESLDAALTLVESAAVPCFVADRQGTGTTALMLPLGTFARPQFGVESATAHRATGLRDISGDVGLDLRTDVDTAEDLGEAQALGLGNNTARLLS